MTNSSHVYNFLATYENSSHVSLTVFDIVHKYQLFKMSTLKSWNIHGNIFHASDLAIRPYMAKKEVWGGFGGFCRISIYLYMNSRSTTQWPVCYRRYTAVGHIWNKIPGGLKSLTNHKIHVPKSRGMLFWGRRSAAGSSNTDAQSWYVLMCTHNIHIHT